MNITVWQHDHATDSRSQIAINTPLWINRAGSPAAERLSDAVMLAAIAPLGDVVAVALIPETLDRVVRHNRIPAMSGTLTLRHADRLDIAAHSFWIAVGTEAEFTQYSASEHNADVYCFLTKARLREGEPIAVCPGTPVKSCGTIYKLSAWEAMFAQREFRCANCNFDPQEPAWRPPPPRPVKRLDAIFELFRQGDRR